MKKHTLVVFTQQPNSLSVLILPLVLPMQGGRLFNLGIQGTGPGRRREPDHSTSWAQAQGALGLPHQRCRPQTSSRSAVRGHLQCWPRPPNQWYRRGPLDAELAAAQGTSDPSLPLGRSERNRRSESRSLHAHRQIPTTTTPGPTNHQLRHRIRRKLRTSSLARPSLKSTSRRPTPDHLPRYWPLCGRRSTEARIQHAHRQKPGPSTLAGSPVNTCKPASTC